MPSSYCSGVEIQDRLRRAQCRHTVPAVVERYAERQLDRKAHHVVGDRASVLGQETPLDADCILGKARAMENTGEKCGGTMQMFGQDRGSETENVGAETGEIVPPRDSMAKARAAASS